MVEGEVVGGALVEGEVVVDGAVLGATDVDDGAVVGAAVVGAEPAASVPSPHDAARTTVRATAAPTRLRSERCTP